MKKLFKIFGIFLFTIFILLIIALFAGFIFLKTFDIKRYKPQIITAASNALGRAVDFKDIAFSVSIKDGVRFHLSDFIIAENPDFGSGDFVFVKEIDAGVDLLAFLTARQISVSAVLVSSAQVSIIRNSAGLLNFQTIKSTTDAPSAGTLPASSVAIPAIFVNSFKIENAQVAFTDQSVAPELKLTVSQLNFDVKQFSLSNPFDVLLEAAILSSEKNFSLSTKLQLDLAKSQVRFFNTDVALDLGQIPLEKLKALPMFSSVSLPELLDGQLKLKVRTAEVSSSGLAKIDADVFFYNGRVVAANIVPGVSLEARRLDVSLENLSLDSAVGSKLNVNAALYQDQVNLDFNASVFWDPSKMQVRIIDGKFLTNLDLWPLKKIQSQIIALKDLPLPESVGGKFETTIKEAIISPSGLQAILLDAKWLGGTVVLKDIIAGTSIALSKTDLEIGNFSLGKQFTISLKTSYLSQMQNLSFSGALAYDLNTQEFSIKNGIAEFNANDFDLGAFKASGLVAENVVLPEEFAGVFQAQISDLTASAKGLGEMKVDLKCQNGKVVFNDITPGVSVAASQINIKIADFSLTNAFAVEASLAYESDESNISLNGQVLLDLAAQKVGLNDMTIKTDFSKLPFEKIKSKIAALKDVQLPQRIKGQLSVAIADASVGPSGLLTLVSDVSLKDGELKLKELGVPITAASADFKITESQLTTDKLVINLGEGQIISTVDVSDYMKRQDFVLSSEIKDIDLFKVLDQAQAPIKIAGLVFGNLKAKGQGADLNSIVSDGNFEVKEVKLKDINVLKIVLDKIAFIPNISSRIEAKLPENYKAKLNDKDTAINKVSGTFALVGGNIVLEPITVQADEFVFSGKSQATFDQTYSLDGAFKITNELSRIMGESSEELIYLYDADNNISLPVHISGKGGQMPMVAVSQSVMDLGKNAVRTEAKKELGKILDKALGFPQDSQSPQQGEDSPEQGQQSATQQIIGDVLNKILK